MKKYLIVVALFLINTYCIHAGIKLFSFADLFDRQEKKTSNSKKQRNQYITWLQEHVETTDKQKAYCILNALKNMNGLSDKEYCKLKKSIPYNESSGER